MITLYILSLIAAIVQYKMIKKTNPEFDVLELGFGRFICFAVSIVFSVLGTIFVILIYLP